MGNYCRYCAHCIENGYNDFYCTLKDKFLTVETVKHWACGSFGDCGIDVITGLDRRERKEKKPKIDDGEQMKIFKTPGRL